MPKSTLVPMLEKLQLWVPLDPVAKTALLKLPHSIRQLRANEFIVREGETPTHCSLLLSGFTYRHKLAGNGARQVFSIHMKGDVPDLHSAILRRSDHDIQCITPVQVARIPVQAIREIATSYPDIGQAMWYDTLVEAAIFREWTLNVGRRDARTRTAHLLCELAIRLTIAGLAEPGDYQMPMTQEQLGDALGLTAIHVNRTLKALDREGLISRTKRSVRIIDFEQLARTGDFDASYLHLNGRTGMAAIGAR